MSLQKVIGLMVIVFTSFSASATNWTICQYEFNTLQVNRADRTITAQLTNAKSITGDCPKLGETLKFHPETLDYQGNLPFKKFPKIGQKRTLIYRYLDGQCKDSGACRIQHFSVK